ncbi:SGNH/GDSL hydrolase family protein [Mycetocola zhadangensis]|uniref:Lipase n=1 Tax=Mycetocola zhadangensis TaxID=1164595 RepID=A0A3L7J142_9MICO|nr:SGNH/GDSL hydrolase family protein [Mycetocola zhadangensis]RLQ84236.1 lipase [Mycetocola zhadangensis]GGE94845.1 lipase [Mycetocola zhadangensis]
MPSETLHISLDVLANSVRGALEIEPVVGGFSPRRLPSWTRAQQADSDIERMASHTSGVSLRLVTAATALGLDITFSRTAIRGQRPAQAASVMCEVDGRLVGHLEADEGTVIVTTRDKTSTTLPGHPSLVLLELGGDGTREREVIVWLPQAASVTIHGGAADAPVRAAKPTDALRWTHYGSAISHGWVAANARGPWPIEASRRLGWDLTNLSFAGNAMLDPFVARVIAGQPSDLITLKVGLDLVIDDVMRRRTFIPALHNFLDLIREGQLDTPIALITALACPILEHATGPMRDVSPGHWEAHPREVLEGDGSLTLSGTRDLVAEVAAARNDDMLDVVNGLSLFTLDDAPRLTDNLHPDQEGHDLIAGRFVGQASDPAATLGNLVGRLAARESSRSEFTPSTGRS